LAALDVATKGDLRRVLGTHLRSFDGPRLIITHDPTDAFLLADRIQIVENGRVTQTGTPADIRRRPATAYVAALAGTNLMTGTNTAGTLRLDGRTRTLQTSDTATSGPVLVTVHPTAIALHNDEPHGSPRNSWATSVATVEPLGDTTRVTLADPLPLGVDVTPAAVASLGIEPGARLWASVKATEVMVTPAS
jgi:molybdate transport system ATP-binding protein